MTTVTASNVVLSNQEYNVVGTRPIRQDGAEKVRRGNGTAGAGAEANRVVANRVVVNRVGVIAKGCAKIRQHY